ncbi:MAG: hypothetical protein ACRC46_15385 [Thermoguttaceae bacterium]
MYTDIETLDLTNQPDEGDPLVWLHAYRRELSRKYPTVEELCEYCRTVPSVEEISARLKREIAEEKALAAAS